VNKEAGQGITFWLSVRDIELVKRFLAERGEDPAQWKKAARKYAKEGVHARIRAYLDAIIV